jgi:ribonucleoside-diphosphate reductase alpha chain
MDFLKDLFTSKQTDNDENRLETEKYDKISARLDQMKDPKDLLIDVRTKSRPAHSPQEVPQEETDNSSISEIHPIPQIQEIHPIQETQEITGKKHTMKKYTSEEALAKTIDYFNGDELAAKVWVNKYALRDKESNLLELTPDDMHRRIAQEFARIEQKYVNPLNETQINDLLKNFRYIVPQGSPMFGIGNKFQIVSLSNCFVIGQDGNSDSYGAIMKTDEEQVQLMKRRGGVGHDLSHIRPEGSRVNNSALTSTGIVPFMERYSNSTREVAQGGRRGALMLSISIKHPDVEKFIDAKMEEDKVTGANVSVKLDDEFMHCVKTGAPYIQQYPVNAKNPDVRKEVDARKIWNKIIHNAWKSAEPGVLFWDTIKKESVPDCYAEFGFETVSTNPCGEIPLCPYDSCRLLALNLYSYVNNPFTETASFDFEKFKSHVAIAQRLMDDLIDLEVEKIDAILQKIASDPESENIKQVETELWNKIREKIINGRRTGLGITAEGDMLAALNIRYGSEKGIEFSTEVHKQMALAAYRSSVELAKERGKFEIYNTAKESQNPFIKRLREADPELYQNMTIHGRRNIALLTIPPTGSVSTCTQTSSGIEPAYGIRYSRSRKVNPKDKNVKVDYVDKNNGDAFEKYYVLHHAFATWAKSKGYDPKKLIDMSDEDLNKLREESPYAKSTAYEIDWLMKVKMQGAVQKWVDHSISVTVNLPEDITEDIISNIYRTAWECGCKGMTIYREGSRPGILTQGKKTGNKALSSTRPEKLEADVVRFKNEEEEWIAVIGLYENRPYEIFTGRASRFHLHPDITKGWVLRTKTPEMEHARYDFIYTDKDGFECTIGGLSRTFKKEYWNYAKLISGILRQGMPLPNVVNLVANLNLENDSIVTWTKGVSRALSKYIKDGTKTGKTCPNCSQDTLIFQSGCICCSNCDYTGC